MSRAKNVFLILACVFLGVALIFFSLTIYYVSTTLHFIFTNKPNIGTVFGSLIYWVIVVIYGVFTIFFAGGILPFDLILMNKYKIKKWYTILLLISSITLMSLSLIAIFVLPVSSSAYHASRHSSSSLSSSM